MLLIHVISSSRMVEKFVGSYAKEEVYFMNELRFHACAYVEHGMDIVSLLILRYMRGKPQRSRCDLPHNLTMNQVPDLHHLIL